MNLLTADAVLRCKHGGSVNLQPAQDLVTIEGRAVLVEPDPESRPIRKCPNISATIKPCTLTLPVRSGYSDLLRIDGHRVCLDTVVGLTHGTPPGIVLYLVSDPGQSFVSEAE